MLILIAVTFSLHCMILIRAESPPINYNDSSNSGQKWRQGPITEPQTSDREDNSGNGLSIAQIEHIEYLLKKLKSGSYKMNKKVSKASLEMQIKGELLKLLGPLLTMSHANEMEVLKLITRNSSIQLNKGVAQGQGKFTVNPVLGDFNCDRNFPLSCMQNEIFRTISGGCNNLLHPSQGQASSMLRRFLPSHYSDNMGLPRGGYQSASGHCTTYNDKHLLSCQCGLQPNPLLPNPRSVSTVVHPDVDIPSDAITHMFVIFGQLLDHDMTLTAESELEEDCCEAAGFRKLDECFPIFADCNSSKFQFGAKATPEDRRRPATYCLPFTRSVEFCGGLDIFDTREQFNGITSYIDASMVYGSEGNDSLSLRQQKDGLMRTGESGHLPLTREDVEVAGDVRALENVALASLHTIWLREHNRIAGDIKKVHGNGRLTDSQIYQESRRILIAQWQNVVYSEWLPILLGPLNMKLLKLFPQLGYKEIYNPNEDASMKNEFSTAAFRFGHSLVQGRFYLADPVTMKLAGEFNLRNAFFNRSLYVDNFLSIVSGLILQPGQRMDRFVTEDLSQFLFFNNEAVAGDLFARNIQRGRDHGLPGYNDYRAFCGMKKVCSFSEVPNEVHPEIWRKLATIYNSPDDIDLFVGGLVELPFNGALVGETFTCIIGKQFISSKFGDRFFYTFKESPYPFNQHQIGQIFKRKFSDIICDNLDMKLLRTNVFDFNSPLTYYCKDRVKLDIKLFPPRSSSVSEY